MEEYVVILTENELNNLKVFLERTNLTGKEAFEFLKIMKKIDKPEIKDA